MWQFMKYEINEIFYSIQGEGFHTGTPAIFIRFSGCNLNCNFCDTDHKNYKTMTAEQIKKECEQYNCKTVILTGGEPSLQVDKYLLNQLRNYNIHIETNGTISLSRIEHLFYWITISPKNYNIKQTFAHELKLINDNIDSDDLKKYRSKGNFLNHYIQPLSNKNVKKTIDLVKGEKGWKLSIQMHKILNIQ